MSKRAAQSRVDDADNVIYANFGARKRVSSCLLYTSDAADDTR